MHARLRGLWARWLDACFQTRCVGCRSWGRSPVCDACERSIAGFPPDACPRCMGDRLPCPFCRLPHPLSHVHAAAPYEGVIRRAVHALKFDGRRELARWLGDRMKASLPPLEKDWVLVPVPLSPERLRMRGFNQAALLAQRIPSFPTAQDGLVRLRNSPPQVGQGRAERWESMQGAFEAARTVEGRRIILVDDVLTTGATLSWAAKALKDAGALEVRAVVAARALISKKMPPPEPGGGNE